MNRFRMLAGIVVATIQVGSTYSDAAGKGPGMSLDGTWKCVFLASATWGEVEDTVLKDIKIEVLGSKATITKGERVDILKIKTDFKKETPEIDIIVKNDSAKDKVNVLRGLFVLKEEQVVIKLGAPGHERPKWVDSGKGFAIIVLKRTK